MPEQDPTPRGTPNRAFFIVGGIGSIMNIVAAILLFFNSLWLFDPWGYVRGFEIMGLAGVILFFIGILLAGIGYLGMRRNFGSAMGIASFVMGLITGILFLLQWIFEFLTYTFDYDYYYYYNYSAFHSISIILMIVAWVIFGVSQIIWGSAHIVNRKFMHSGLSIATGILLIIAGAFSASVLLSFVGIILFAAAEIMATILFFMAKIPEAHS